MIVVCECGTRLRIKQLSRVDDTRCPTCKTMASKEAHRQAERNAAIILELASLMYSKDTWTPEEEHIVHIMQTHELTGRRS